jgi:hypothetical protein
VVGVYDAVDHLAMVYSGTAPGQIGGTPTIASVSTVPGSTGALSVGESFIGSTATSWTGGILDPAGWDGVADTGQMIQLSDLTPPVDFTATIGGS